MAKTPIDHRETLGQFFSVARGRADLAVIDERIESAARIDGIHMLQLISAMLIASIGLNINSTEAVIGAMLICPLMGSVIELAYVVATMAKGAFTRALMGLIVQVIVCVATSTFYFALSPLDQTTSYLQAMAETTVWDLMIALVGGFAGGLGISRHETPSTLIAGVAVATALMPPLCTVGYGLAEANMVHALMALYLFFVNVIFIGVGAEIVFMGLGIPLEADYNNDGIADDEEVRSATTHQHWMRRSILALALIFSIPCILYTQNKVKVTINQGNLTLIQDTYHVEYTSSQIKAVLDDDFVDYSVGEEHFMNQETGTLETRVVATVVSRTIPPKKTRTDIEELIKLSAPDVAAVSFVDKAHAYMAPTGADTLERANEEEPQGAEAEPEEDQTEGRAA